MIEGNRIVKTLASDLQHLLEPHFFSERGSFSGRVQVRHQIFGILLMPESPTRNKNTEIGSVPQDSWTLSVQLLVTRRTW